jgi:hypothetical protein
VAEIVIEIDPPAFPRITVCDYMVTAHIPMLLAVLMQKAYRFHAFNEIIQYSGKIFVKIRFVIDTSRQIPDMIGKRLTINQIYYTDDIAFFVLNREPVHEIIVASDQIKDARFFPRAPEAFKLDAAYPGQKLFEENQFYYLRFPAPKVNGAFHPEFDFIVQTEAALFRIVAYKVRHVIQNHYIAVFNTVKITGIPEYIKIVPRFVISHPGKGEPVKVFLGEIPAHASFPAIEVSLQPKLILSSCFVFPLLPPLKNKWLFPGAPPDPVNGLKYFMT